MSRNQLSKLNFVPKIGIMKIWQRDNVIVAVATGLSMSRTELTHSVNISTQISSFKFSMTLGGLIINFQLWTPSPNLLKTKFPFVQGEGGLVTNFQLLMLSPNLLKSYIFLC